MLHDLSTQKGRNAYVEAMSKPKAVEIKLDRQTFINNVEKLVLRRFDTVSEINDSLHNLLGISVSLQPKTRDEFEGEYDFCLISNCEVNGEELCWLDIYYLKDNGGKMIITEVGYDFNI